MMFVEVFDEFSRTRKELDSRPEEVLEGVALLEVGLERELYAWEGVQEMLCRLQFSCRTRKLS